MKMVKDCNGNEIDFELAATMMDDDIREHLHFKLAPCSEQEFYNAYVKLHKEIYGEEFTI